jgi:hypothetical protein
VAIEFDPAKDAANIAKHGVSLARTGELAIWAFTENSRPEEAERRFRLYGLLDGEAYCAVVSWRTRPYRHSERLCEHSSLSPAGRG